MSEKDRNAVPTKNRSRLMVASILSQFPLTEGT